ncbi:MAG: PD40 domain-containing protein [Gemmatimonadaceae bacterium]|nr:PD40 domain-containing protein [Gemmatimonadaceae bacterium]
MAVVYLARDRKLDHEVALEVLRPEVGATGDRGIDARSDVYSLASVLYEMLAGEPAVTGASAQSMIAILMTERPTHLRVLRDTVPEEIDAAVAKALAKTPADRFASAGDFSKALDVKPGTLAAARTASEPRPKSKRVAIVGGVMLLAAIVAAGAFAMRGKHGSSSAVAGTAASLGQRTQLTTSGAVIVPAISPDGKQLAYITKKCASGVCKYTVVEQDVGGTTTRMILEGASAGCYLEWSPDRRNLMFNGTVNGAHRYVLLSALGGEPRFITQGVATFFAGGDSLLIGPCLSLRLRLLHSRRIARRLGARQHSRAGAGQGIAAISSMPGTSWIVTLILQQPHGLWQIIDRAGKVADHVVNACTCGGKATFDAVWLQRLGDGTGESIARIAVDPATGRLATRQDTMVTGLFTGFSITDDGKAMVMDEGTYDFNVWNLDSADVLKGRYPDERRVAHASSPVSANLSPDGARLTVRRDVPTGGGHAEVRYWLMPFGGGMENPINSGGRPFYVAWSDSVTLDLGRQTPAGLHLTEMDVRTNAQRNALDLPDSVLASATSFSDGWAWIPATGDKIIVKRAGKAHEYAKPPGVSFVYDVIADQAGNRLFYTGPDATTGGDSLTFGVLSPDNGAFTQWGALTAEFGHITPLAGGSVFIVVSQSQESLSFFKSSGPGQMRPLGVSPRPLRNLSVSRDMKRASAFERDYRADAWMSKVVTHD